MTRLTENWDVLGPRLPCDLRIEPWTESNCEAIRPWLPGGEWKKWHEPQFEPLLHRYVDGALYRLRSEPWQLDRASHVPRTLALIEGTDCVGMIGWIWRDYAAGWRRFDIAIYDPARWGRGLGTAFCRGWTDWLMTLPDTHRLDFVTWSGHAAMLGIGRRLGFEVDARLKDAYVFDGVRVAEVVMSKINPDPL